MSATAIKFTEWRIKDATYYFAPFGVGWPDKGPPDTDLGFDHSHLSWQQLTVLVAQTLINHSGICAAQQPLREAGMAFDWIVCRQEDLTVVELRIPVHPDSLAAVSKVAKAASGVATKAEAAEFDRVFDLYMKQN